MRLPQMPQIYLDEVKGSGGAAAKCPLCKAPTQRSLCELHLVQAARKFRQWTAQRVRKGLCIVCPKEGDMLPPLGNRRTRRGIRCAFHRGINAQRCKTWCAENGKAKFWALKKAGLCTSSAAHGPATNGNLCAACRLRSQESQRRHDKRAKRLRASARAGAPRGTAAGRASAPQGNAGVYGPV